MKTLQTLVNMTLPSWNGVLLYEKKNDKIRKEMTNVILENGEVIAFTKAALILPHSRF